jgi:hypothetical protein
MELNLKTVAQSLSLLGLAFIPVSGRVRTLYRALADVNSLCREKLYQNLGYWKDGPGCLDMAAEAMADLLARTASLSGEDEALDVGFGFAEGRSFWQIPKENLYHAAIYRKKIEDCGFVMVDMRSIWSDVYPPFVEFARNRLKDRELAERMNPLFRRMLMSSLKARRRLSPEAMDYVLVSAVKPGKPA